MAKRPQDLIDSFEQQLDQDIQKIYKKMRQDLIPVEQKLQHSLDSVEDKLRIYGTDEQIAGFHATAKKQRDQIKLDAPSSLKSAYAEAFTKLINDQGLTNTKLEFDKKNNKFNLDFGQISSEKIYNLMTREQIDFDLTSNIKAEYHKAEKLFQDGFKKIDSSINSLVKDIYDEQKHSAEKIKKHKKNLLPSGIKLVSGLGCIIGATIALLVAAPIAIVAAVGAVGLIATFVGGLEFNNKNVKAGIGSLIFSDSKIEQALESNSIKEVLHSKSKQELISQLQDMGQNVKQINEEINKKYELEVPHSKTNEQKYVDRINGKSEHQKAKPNRGKDF